MSILIAKARSLLAWASLLLCLMASAMLCAVDYLHKETVLGVYPIYLYNSGKTSIPLYSVDTHSNAKPIIHLKPRESFRFYYAGSKGVWMYGVKNGLSVVDKSQKLTKVFIINDRKAFFVDMSLMLAGLGVLGFLFLYPKTIFDRVPNGSGLKKVNTTLPLHSEFDSLEDLEVQGLKGEIALLREKMQQEFETKTNVIIAEREQAYAALENQLYTLNNKYEKIKKDGKVLDIDFDSKVYENILKGRKFEQYIAHLFSQDAEFTVLEWASDKGFGKSIYVKANSNPDLIVLHNKSGKKIAVECKYRSGLWKASREGKHLTWANTSQAERYVNFANEQNMPVLVVVGFGGSPDAPNRLYLTEVNKLINMSFDELSHNRALLKVTPLAALYNSYLKDGFTNKVKESLL